MKREEGANLKAKKMSNIKNLKQLNDFLGEAGTNYVLIDFFANWCGPCKEIGPKVDQLAQQLGNLTIVKVNVDESEEIVEAYEVSALPTFVMLKSKKKLETFTGSDFDKLKEMVLTVTKRKAADPNATTIPGPTDRPRLDSKQISVGKMVHGPEAIPPGQSNNQPNTAATPIKMNKQQTTKIQKQLSASKLTNPKVVITPSAQALPVESPKDQGVRPEKKK